MQYKAVFMWYMFTATMYFNVYSVNRGFDHSSEIFVVILVFIRSSISSTQTNYLLIIL